MKLVFLLFLTSSLLLSGCASYTRVETHSNAFYHNQFSAQGNIYVQASTPELQQSLAFTHYQQAINEALLQVGFTIATEPTTATWVAVVDIQSHQPNQTVHQQPIIGQVGSQLKLRRRPVLLADGTTRMRLHQQWVPSYGVVGHSTYQVAHYQHQLNLDIFAAEHWPPFSAKTEATMAKLNAPESNPIKWFEGQTLGISNCPLVYDIFPALLTAMFTNFPNENGQSQRQLITLESRC
ncbi:MAG: hypothetical protein R3Y10_08990 [Ferrimonas sp.]